MTGQNQKSPLQKRAPEELSDRESIALQHNETMIEALRNSRQIWLARLMSRELRKTYAAYEKADHPASRLELGAEVLNLFDQSISRRLRLFYQCWKEDIHARRQRSGRSKVIDHTDRNVRDYYSVAVIVKNEARYIREFILFYRATGADRIYIYDNDSTDHLLDEIEPFLQSGLVVYIRWPGQVVQRAAYRDVVRRTRNRTRWLAIIDADEFLFSPRGSMPQQLRDFESYPGIGVNWVMFGPNGHDRRPEGLVMDNYTTTIADRDYIVNCHIKSIVQPKEVLLTNHTHFSYYKRNVFAVDERKSRIDNRNAYAPSAGRAFTANNHTDIFRINHYSTKSLEDLEEKCARGYADGASNLDYERALQPFRGPLVEDDVIKPYADLVRKQYNQD